MKAMPTRENYLRAARRQEHEWITLDFGFSQEARKMFNKRVGEGIDPADYFRFDGRWMTADGPSKQPRPDWRKLYYSDGSLPESANIDSWGVGRDHDSQSDDDRVYFPLRNITTVEEVEAYPWPDAGESYRYEGFSEKVRAVQAKDHPVHVSGPNYFEFVWNIRGFEQLMMDMAMDSPVAELLFEHMLEINIRKAEQAARCGADVLLTGSDIASQLAPLMSPAMLKKYVFSAMQKCIQAAKAIKPDILILYHSCGNVEPLIDDIVEAGVDILDPCQPEAMDVFELKRRYGDVLSFHGGIGVQSVLPYGTVAEVRDMVRKTIDIMAEGGGYLCSSAHMIRPEVPWENIMAFVETVREYGEAPTDAAIPCE